MLYQFLKSNPVTCFTYLTHSLEKYSSCSSPQEEGHFFYMQTEKNAGTTILGVVPCPKLGCFAAPPAVVSIPNYATAGCVLHQFALIPGDSGDLVSPRRRVVGVKSTFFSSGFHDICGSGPIIFWTAQLRRCRLLTCLLDLADCGRLFQACVDRRSADPKYVLAGCVLC